MVDFGGLLSPNPIGSITDSANGKLFQENHNGRKRLDFDRELALVGVLVHLRDSSVRLVLFRFDFGKWATSGSKSNRSLKPGADVEQAQFRPGSSFCRGTS